MIELLMEGIILFVAVYAFILIATGGGEQ